MRSQSHSDDIVCQSCLYGGPSWHRLNPSCLSDYESGPQLLQTAFSISNPASFRSRLSNPSVNHLWISANIGQLEPACLDVATGGSDWSPLGVRVTWQAAS